jgi:hypothetical protein
VGSCFCVGAGAAEMRCQSPSAAAIGERLWEQRDYNHFYITKTVGNGGETVRYNLWAKVLKSNASYS